MSLYELYSRNQILEQSTTSTRSALDLTARILTEICAPWVLVTFVPTFLAWHTTHSIAAGIKWGFLVSASSSIVPMLFVLWGIKQKRWSNHHALNRTDRFALLGILGISSVTGLVLLLIFNAPRVMIALHATMLLSAIITGGIMHFARLKISIHCAVNASLFVVLIVGATALWILPFSPLIAGVAWSRVRLGHHTKFQVIAGVVMGIFVGGGIFILLM